MKLRERIKKHIRLKSMQIYIKSEDINFLSNTITYLFPKRYTPQKNFNKTQDIEGWFIFAVYQTYTIAFIRGIKKKISLYLAEVENFHIASKVRQRVIPYILKRWMERLLERLLLTAYMSGLLGSI